MNTQQQKIQDARDRLEAKLEEVKSTPEKWREFLGCAATNYKYSFEDSLMIHADRPHATACANISLWNKKYDRWVKRGTKGIGLPRENANGSRYLEYVFDITDTRTRSDADLERIRHEYLDL